MPHREVTQTCWPAGVFEDGGMKLVLGMSKETGD